MSGDWVSKKALMSHIQREHRQWGEDYDTEQILGDIEDFPTAFDAYEVIAKIIEDLDARIDNQLKILAGIGDEAHRYGFVKTLEAYQQCKMIVEQNFEEYKRK